MAAFEFIDTPGALHRFLERTADERVFALDTEFIREKTFYAKLCLVQVRAGEHIACVDPLAIENLEPLWERLEAPETLILLHAGRQDLEVIFQASGRIPEPVFDTQIAAALCGYGDQVGYAALVRTVLGIDLDKSMTRADWARRPLPPDALDYAAEDVRYLHELHDHLVERLRELGRENWLAPELASLTDPANYSPDAGDAWRRIRGAARLKPKEVAILKALAEWREQEAIRLDRPRQWLLKDDTLIFLAQRPPRNMAELAAVRGIDERFVGRNGEALIHLIEHAKNAAPPEDLPVDKPRLTPGQEAQTDLLMAALRAIAEDAALAPASIASRKDLERLVRGERDLDLLHGWRLAAAGERLLAVIEGRLALAATPEGLRFLPLSQQ